jgi:hypothetical protein
MILTAAIPLACLSRAEAGRRLAPELFHCHRRRYLLARRLLNRDALTLFIANCYIILTPLCNCGLQPAHGKQKTFA